MLAKSKITVQEAHELRSFTKNLGARRVTTPEFKSVLMILRRHCDKESALLEWTDSVAHKKRDRGFTFAAGANLWVEKFRLNAFFTSPAPQLKKIPIPIFESYLNLINDPNFYFDGINMGYRFPGGFSRKEMLASLNWMYQRYEKEGVYKLMVSMADANVEDLALMRLFIWKFESIDWGEPYHFNEVLDNITINRETPLARGIHRSKRR
jgi:hypothetical protein